MSYRPQVGDTVRIKNYTGVLHPNTVWDVKEVRPDIVQLAVHTGDLTMQRHHEHWRDIDQLIQVKRLEQAGNGQ